MARVDTTTPQQPRHGARDGAVSCKGERLAALGRVPRLTEQAEQGQQDEPQADHDHGGVQYPHRISPSRLGSERA